MPVRALLLILLPFIANIQDSLSKVFLEITNPEPRQGRLSISVYDDKEGFPSVVDKAIRRLDVKISVAPCLVILELPVGVYAKSVAHDLNDNKEGD